MGVTNHLLTVMILQVPIGTWCFHHQPCAAPRNCAETKIHGIRIAWFFHENWFKIQFVEFRCFCSILKTHYQFIFIVFFVHQPEQTYNIFPPAKKKKTFCFHGSVYLLRVVPYSHLTLVFCGFPNSFSSKANRERISNREIAASRPEQNPRAVSTKPWLSGDFVTISGVPVFGVRRFIYHLYTVDGSEIRPSPVEVGSLSDYLQGFIHPRWLFGISEPSTIWVLTT